MTTLDHEQFEGAKVLAEIGTKIAEGRALLITLDASKETYLEEREKEALERVAKALESSKELLTEIGSNHSELEGFRTQVGEIVSEVRTLLEDIAKFREAFQKYISDERGALTEKQRKIDEALIEIRKGRSLLDAQQLDIQNQKREIGTSKKALRDEWAALERASAEIKSNKKIT